MSDENAMMNVKKIDTRTLTNMIVMSAMTKKMLKMRTQRKSESDDEYDHLAIVLARCSVEASALKKMNTMRSSKSAI